jgi:uncharacterized 2Fe-2S/4Fe-4S cluster protein (DUF4445 family)
MNTYRVDFEPLGIRADCSEGSRLLDVARQAGVGLTSICGGNSTCGRCMVRVISGRVSPISQTERDLMDDESVEEGMRLACLTRVLDHVKIEVPPCSRLVDQRLQLDGIDVDVPFDPVVKDVVVGLATPHMGDLRSDQRRLFEQLSQVLDQEINAIDLFALRQAATVLRNNQWHARVSLHGQEVIDIHAPDQRPLGLAVDLGTTKIAVYLVDLDTGQTLAVEGIPNPQIAYGEDVMSRIAYAMQGEVNRLRQVVIEGLNQVIASMCSRPEEIVDVSLVGNTAMHHLFLGLPVRQLGLAPYLPTAHTELDVKARDLGLSIAPGAYVHLLPNIAGFVGADHVAMILATSIYRTQKTVIGLDIGTNTEVVLAHDGVLTSCSTASGPAFEGAHIRYGMRAASGAIEKVQLSHDKVEVKTIDDQPAIGLCGSGILDAISELNGAGLLSSRGKLLDGLGVRQNHSDREYLLVPAECTGCNQDITISERDIAEILLAKAAIRTGMDVLLADRGISAEDVDEIIIAGAFGTHISVVSGIKIGLFPPLPVDHFRQVGNAAGIGARLALVSGPQRQLAVEVAGRVHYLELLAQEKFPNQFAHNIYLPQP